MGLTNDEINRIADALFERFVERELKYEEENSTYIISDEFGNSKQVDELEYLHFELVKLEELLKTYIDDEEYRKADILMNKIKKLKIKIQKL